MNTKLEIASQLLVGFVTMDTCNTEDEMVAWSLDLATKLITEEARRNPIPPVQSEKQKS